MATLKKCPKCSIEKDINEFGKNRLMVDGLCYYCKNCISIMGKKYYDNNKKEICKKVKDYREFNKEKISRKKREYYFNNFNEIKKKNMEYYWDNIDNIKKQKKKYYENNIIYILEYRKDNKDKIREQKKEWYQRNIEKELNRMRLYRQNNKQKMNEQARYYYMVNSCKINECKRDYYKNNPGARISRSISRLIWYSLKGNKNGLHWENIVNFTLQEFKDDFKKKFIDDMNWNNYGKWHIHHRIPISLWEFNSYDNREFKQCWALCNLQPVWAEENISKGNRIYDNNGVL